MSKWVRRMLRLLAVVFFIAVVAAADLGPAALAADLSDFSGSQSAALDAAVRVRVDAMTQLYYVCRADPVCAARFYLAASASAESMGNDAARRLQVSDESSDKIKFFRLAMFWEQQDDSPLRENSQRPRLLLSDYQAEDAAWWLTVMSTARPCGDNNQVWELNQGCVPRPDRVDDDGDPIKARKRLDSVGQPLAVLTVSVFALLIFGAIVGAIFIIKREFAKTRDAIRSAQQLWEGKPPRDTDLLSLNPPLINAQANDSDVVDSAQEQQFGAAHFVAHTAANAIHG